MTRQIIKYRLTLEAPLVLSLPGGDANSAETFSFVTGSSILGALAHSWLQNPLPGNPAEQPEFRSLFLDGSVRYCHAYPEGEGGERLLPAPLSLHIEKGMESQVYDLSWPEKEDVLYDADMGRTRDLIPWGRKYVRFADRDVKYREPRLTSRIHHQRDRRLGRATEASGEIFSYISLERGERFIGRILIEKPELSEKLQSLLSKGNLRLGRSKSAQYGGEARVEVLEECQAEKGSPELLEVGEPVPVSPGRMVITLLSDYLGTNQHGHYTADSLLPEIESKLETGPRGLRCVAAFTRVAKVSGYVSHWRMPRPVRPAVRAGSVFVLELLSNIDPKKLGDLLWNGIGDRKAEGFGRIAIDWHGVGDEDGGSFIYNLAEDANLEVEKALQSALDPADDLPCSRSEALLALTRKRLLQNAIEGALIAAGEQLVRPGHQVKGTSKALLGRLRACLRTAENPQSLLDFLDACRNKPAEKQMNRCAIGGETLREWLEHLFADGTRIDHLLCIRDVAGRVYLDNRDRTQAAFSDMRWEYQKRLADMVLQKLVLLKKAEEGARNE